MLELLDIFFFFLLFIFTICSQACHLTPPVLQARREKISERMKILQDLVPGCNKVLIIFCWTITRLMLLYFISFIVCLFVFNVQVIGKALVLDEIINYIQSLQRQVEVDFFIFPSLFGIFTR